MSSKYQGIGLPEYKIDGDKMKKARDAVFVIEDKNPEHKAKRTEKEKRKQEKELKQANAQAHKDKVNQYNQMIIQQFSIARQMVSKSLDERIDQEVKKIQEKFNISNEAKEKIRATIRGHKNVSLNKEALVVLTQEKAAKEINKAINKQVNNFYDNTKVGHIMKAVNKTNDDILHFCKNMEKYAKDATPDNLAASITAQLDHALTKTAAIDKVTDKLNSQLQKIGLGGFDCKTIIGPVIQNFNTKGAGAQLAAKLQPFIQKNIKLIQSVTKVIQKIDAAIKKFEEKINQMLSKAAAALTDLATKAIDGVVSNLASNIKISF